MPKFTKLTAEELESFRAPVSGERAKIREEYRGYLRDLQAGEGGELILNNNEKKITIKNRLKRAAQDLELNLEFKRSGENVVRFRIVPEGENQ